MTTNPKSKCCGATLVFKEGIYRCFNCGNKELVNQPTSRLDEASIKCAKIICYGKHQPTGSDVEIVADKIKLAIQEYTEEAKEKCKTCGCLCNPSYVESGECIFCIAKNLQQSLTKANEELVELRKDKERLDWMESQSESAYLIDNKLLINFTFGRDIEETSIRQAIDSAIAAQEKGKK